MSYSAVNVNRVRDQQGDFTEMKKREMMTDREALKGMHTAASDGATPVQHSKALPAVSEYFPVSDRALSVAITTLPPPPPPPSITDCCYQSSLVLHYIWSMSSIMMRYSSVCFTLLLVTNECFSGGVHLPSTSCQSPRHSAAATLQRDRRRRRGRSAFLPLSTSAKRRKCVCSLHIVSLEDREWQTARIDVTSNLRWQLVG